MCDIHGLFVYVRQGRGLRKPGIVTISRIVVLANAEYRGEPMTMSDSTMDQALNDRPAASGVEENLKSRDTCCAA